MQLSLDNNLEQYSIKAYDEDGLQIIVPPSKTDKDRPEIQLIDYSIILTPVVMESWEPERHEQLDAEHFARLLEWEPEVALFGSGRRLRFPAAEVLAPLHRQGVGVEVMDTAAACRTFNILASEGRRVVAAMLMFESA
ncbi:MAG: Xcc1710-like domain-containing protein [Gammaproteobacteria bacterium]|nr:Xcc1710-like domain-containing protein [Gammaproteobacteria bacterium]